MIGVRKAAFRGFEDVHVMGCTRAERSQGQGWLSGRVSPYHVPAMAPRWALDASAHTPNNTLVVPAF